jgi:hypothetical protein
LPAPGSPPLAIIQLIDGIGAVVFAVPLPLVVADITNEAGHYTLALGVAGMVADWLGRSAAGGNRFVRKTKPSAKGADLTLLVPIEDR